MKVLLFVDWLVAAVDSIVDSINETVRKYCADDDDDDDKSVVSSHAGLHAVSSTDQPTARRLRLDISASPCSSCVPPCSSVAPLHRSALTSSARKPARMNSVVNNTSDSYNNNSGEISFADVARGMLTPPSSNQHSALVNKPLSSNQHSAVLSRRPASVDASVQVSPRLDLRGDGGDVSEAGRVDVGIQVQPDELLGSRNDAFFPGQCCPYCYTQLPAGYRASTVDSGIHLSAKDSGMHHSVVSSIALVDNGMLPLPSVSDTTSTRDSGTHLLSVPPVDDGIHPLAVSFRTAAAHNGMRPLSSVSVESVAVSSPLAAVPVQCCLSLGDSFHYSPLRSSTAPVSVSPSLSAPNETGLLIQAATVCRPPLNTSLNDSILSVAAVNTSLDDAGLVRADGSAMQSALPATTLSTCESSPLVDTPAVQAFCVTPAEDAARLPPASSADSGAQLSNTSLSNITLSDLLPSMHASIPLELLVNQTAADAFTTMYTEVVPVPDAAALDDALDRPAAAETGMLLDAAPVVSHHQSPSPPVVFSRDSWSTHESQSSPVNMMVRLPISSVSSPGHLPSFLASHESLSSFAGDTAAAVAMPSSALNYSIHRIVEASALTQGTAAVADCSWSSSNTGVLISRADIPANHRAALSDSSLAEDDRGRPPDDSFHGNGCHGDRSFHGDESVRGNEDAAHDDVCVIDSDVIVIDADDEILRPTGSDLDPSAVAVSERTCRVGRHGRHRRRQHATNSAADIRLFPVEFCYSS